MKHVIYILIIVLVAGYGVRNAEAAYSWGVVNGFLTTCAYKNIGCSLNDLSEVKRMTKP